MCEFILSTSLKYNYSQMILGFNLARFHHMKLHNKQTVKFTFKHDISNFSFKMHNFSF